MTVPAHQWMWSAHDVVNHHQRRYSKAALRRLIDGSPLKLESMGYFNSLLFPVALAERWRQRCAGKTMRTSHAAGADQSGVGADFAAERLDRPPTLPPGFSLFAVASAT